MILLTETVLYYWDCLDGLYRQSSLESTKDGFAGVGPVKDWADKLASVKPLHPLLSRDSSLQVRTISSSTGNSTQIKGPRNLNTQIFTSMATIKWSPKGHIAAGSVWKSMTTVEWSPKEHVATSSLCVISGSELDDPEFSAPQPRAWKDHGVVKTTDHYDDVPSDDDADEGSVLVNTTKKGIKCMQCNQADARSSQPNVPSSKRAKTHRNTFRTQCSGSGANNKYINSDLPAGSTNDNLWHRIFISTLAHCAAGNKDPWVIPEGKFKATLQEIWDAVYKDSIEHTVVSGGPVYQLAKQGLNNW
ncbi:hypothetical protein SCLCIDRAFT_28837 [Scleroderma citrinum Foug A]|uniref:Uncharacterized protein n=1 Tax=Scleroderma citrinum Foug A TaxID=1036808 RepID=A0A0C2ZYH1_9AGAM|nr:hypothetical protein SCLCIDRAFT_28837 [Scleroderma citrinum Foug A]